jgi:ribosomal protein L5
MNRLYKYYSKIIRVDLLMKDHYINVMELPQLNNITLNTGIGLKAILDKKQILNALLNMELISGQRPIITRAKKSIDKFKLREKMPVGCKVTLRKSNLYEFLDRFVNLIIPSMDNSNDIFNSLYFKQFSKKQELAFSSFTDVSLVDQPQVTSSLLASPLSHNYLTYDTPKFYFK